MAKELTVEQLNTAPEEEVKTDGNVYTPNRRERRELNFVYKEVQEMVDEKNRTWRQFNDRTLFGFIDDSEKRVQGYVPDRESQGKEEWQSNVFSQDTRNKLKGVIAGISSQLPETKLKAVGTKGGDIDMMRAEVMKELIRFSRMKHNPQLDAFWQAWQVATQGTIIVYDGYLKTRYKRKFIKSYDLESGRIDFETREVTVNDEAIDHIVPLQELFIKNFQIYDIQDQPAIAWIRYMNKQDTKMEFGKYKNWDKVLTKGESGEFKGDTETFMDQVFNRTAEDEYEVIKYYNRFLDKYVIVINGVLLLAAPMLWGRADKVYPFAKSIFEPFVNKKFFYGNSLPNANMDIQDVINALWNMMLDKTNRSLNKYIISSVKNKDLLELEEERVGFDTTVYVEDVAQVKEFPAEGVNQSEAGMLKIASQKFDMATIDPTQQGFAGRGVTAREIVIANENAKKIMGLFFTFMEDLWVQKDKLRILTILQNYTLPKVEEVVGEDGSVTYEESFRTFFVEGSQFGDRSRGTLAIQMVGTRDQLPSREELDIEEEKMFMQGENFQKMAITSMYLDNYDYDIQVIPKSLNQTDKVEVQAVNDEKMNKMAAFFPEIFLQNKAIIFEDFLKGYDDSPDRYVILPTPGPEQTVEGAGEASAGAEPVEPPALPEV